ncbi:MAG: hypothetical protein ACOZQL_26195 [Myxococcota bacterium]
MRILSGIEEGTMTAAQSAELAADADPALVYLIFTWIRRRYADHPNADAVVGRLLAVLDREPSLTAKMKEGQADPVVAWFEEEHSYCDLPAREFIELVVDKLES